MEDRQPHANADALHREAPAVRIVGVGAADHGAEPQVELREQLGLGRPELAGLRAQLVGRARTSGRRSSTCPGRRCGNGGAVSVTELNGST